MPNNESCKKRLRQDAKRRIHNRNAKKTIKTITRKIYEDITTEEREVLVKDIYSKLDKAAKVNQIHKRNASRRKSRIMAFINKEKAQQQNN